MASIVIVANSIDQALISFTGNTYALELSPDFGFHSFNDIEVLYNAPYIAIPLGYALLGIVCVPLGMKNLNENARTVQTVSFVMTITLLLLFLGYFVAKGSGSPGPPTAVPPALSAGHNGAGFRLALGRVSGLHASPSEGEAIAAAAAAVTASAAGTAMASDASAVASSAGVAVAGAAPLAAALTSNSSAATGFHPLPAVGSTFSQLASVFIFTWAYVIFVPR